MSVVVIEGDRTDDRPATPALARVRLDSIDLLRGLVMVLMALDHARDYFTAVRFDPLDLTQTSPGLFLTRWITHFCAPVFVFLAGTSAYLVSLRRSRSELSRLLWTRGLWLIFLEVVVINFAWTFEPGFFLQVIWVIGCSMLILSLLVHLPVWVIGAFGVVMIAGHNLLDGIAPTAFGAWAPLWHLLHVQGEIPIGYLLYPLIPWCGVMAAGYAFGVVYTLDATVRRRILLGLGCGLIAFFSILRGINVYGDPHPWSAQSTPLLTLLSFIKVEKYPPSLLYLLATLGPAMLLLAWFENLRGEVAAGLTTIGRVPLFFYVAHILLIHLLAGVTAATMGFGTGLLKGWPEIPHWGFALPGVYLIWAGVVLALYPACRWFAAVKRRRNDWWLSYL